VALNSSDWRADSREVTCSRSIADAVKFRGVGTEAVVRSWQIHADRCCGIGAGRAHKATTDSAVGVADALIDTEGVAGLSGTAVAWHGAPSANGPAASWRRVIIVPWWGRVVIIVAAGVVVVAAGVVVVAAGVVIAPWTVRATARRQGQGKSKK